MRPRACRARLFLFTLSNMDPAAPKSLSPGLHALRQWRTSIEGRRYFITCCTHNRLPLLTADTAASLVFDRLRRLETDCGFIELHASVVMPDHLHVLFRLTGASELPVVMKRFRGNTAQSLNAALDRIGPVWQRGYFDRLLRPDDSTEMILHYMWHNPEVPGCRFRCRSEIWSWFRQRVSSAAEYAPWLPPAPPQ